MEHALANLQDRIIKPLQQDLDLALLIPDEHNVNRRIITKDEGTAVIMGLERKAPGIALNEIASADDHKMGQLVALRVNSKGDLILAGEDGLCDQAVPACHDCQQVVGLVDCYLLAVDVGRVLHPDVD